jgi:hypothetical protein
MKISQSAVAKSFNHLSNVLESQYGYQLINILDEDDNEDGKCYELRFKCRKRIVEEFEEEGEKKTREVLKESVETEVLIQHFSSSGMFYVWASDLDNYLSERREISLMIQKFMKLPKEEKIKQSEYFAENLAEYNPVLVSQMLNA